MNWVWKLYDDERRQYALANDLCLMQMAYEEQGQGQVTQHWGRFPQIAQGDIMIAATGDPFTIYAIGEVLLPRLPADNHDTVHRTTADHNHLFEDGIVYYEDAPFFYEDLRLANGFGGGHSEGWAQRVDVVRWHYVVPHGVSIGGVADHIGANCGILLQVFFCVDDDFRTQCEHALRNIAMATIESLVQATNFFRQVVLQGPPGTSKTFAAAKLTAHLCGFTPDAAVVSDHPQYNEFHALKGDTWDLVQFHPAYNYEDFVRGIQVSTEGGGGQGVQPPVIRYDTVHRVFSEMCMRASAPENAKKKFVLVIDEINRANLAAVLGELIYALEYRGQSIRTPYSVNGNGYNLSVPPNLYVIGTMNTADRSIGHIDYAVRRRFAFVPMLPDPEVLTLRYLQHPQLGESARALFDAVAGLFAGENCRLSREFHRDDVQPGHTYFLVDENLDVAEACKQLIYRFVYQVLPLLREYVKDGVLAGSAEQLVVNVENIGDGIILTQSLPPGEVVEQLRNALCPGL
jgi:MoxR-like ATPase